MWGVGEKSAEEKAALITNLVAQVPDETTGAARRFLVAREWKLTEAIAMLVSCREWRETVLAKITRTPAIEAVLASPRFRVVKRGSEPVLLVDFLWGGFLKDAEFDDILHACTLPSLERATSWFTAARLHATPLQGHLLEPVASQMYSSSRACSRTTRVFCK